MLFKGEKSKHLCALAKTCLCREPRKLLQMRSWTVGWGKRRNPTYQVLFILWSLLLFEWWRRLMSARLSKMSAWAYGVVNSLDICSKLVPLLFHSCVIHLFWCSLSVDTFVFLSSVNQHLCRTEEVQGANLSKAGSRYPVILHWFFSPSVCCMNLVSTVFI